MIVGSIALAKRKLIQNDIKPNLLFYILNYIIILLYSWNVPSEWLKMLKENITKSFSNSIVFFTVYEIEVYFASFTVKNNIINI